MTTRICLAVAAVLVAASASAEEAIVSLGGNATLQLIKVEAGKFTQGSPESEKDRAADETPREVTLTKPFYIGKFPVTRAQYARFVEDTRYRTESEVGSSGGFGWDGSKLAQRKDFTWRTPGFDQAGDEPVVLVTWFDAKAFTDWLSRKTGAAFDLPSEAQWEYACRAGTATAFANGNDPEKADDLGWHKGNANYRTHSAGEKQFNAWGIADLPGNAWEWCLDWYGPYPPGPATDPVQTNQNLSDKPRRVLRGGSWLKDATGMRSAARFRNDPRSRNADNGFRVIAWSLPKPRPVGATTATPSAPIERTDSATPSAATEEPSAATAHDAPVPYQHSRGIQTSPVKAFGSVLCCGGFFFALIALLTRIVRSFTSGKSAGPVVPNIGSSPGSAFSGRSGGVLPRTRLGPDGFWLDGGDIAPGTLLLCRYMAGGSSHSIEVSFAPQPGGQFIYTGARPESVTLAMAGSSVPPPRTRLRDDDDDDFQDRRRRSSFPSAY